MPDFDWIRAENTTGALNRLPKAPLRWLMALARATHPAGTLQSVEALMRPFQRSAPLTGFDPLAALAAVDLAPLPADDGDLDGAAADQPVSPRVSRAAVVNPGSPIHLGAHRAPPVRSPAARAPASGASGANAGPGVKPLQQTGLATPATSPLSMTLAQTVPEAKLAALSGRYGPGPKIPGAVQRSSAAIRSDGSAHSAARRGRDRSSSTGHTRATALPKIPAGSAALLPATGSAPFRPQVEGRIKAADRDGDASASRRRMAAGRPLPATLYDAAFSSKLLVEKSPLFTAARLASIASAQRNIPSGAIQPESGRLMLNSEQMPAHAAAPGGAENRHVPAGSAPKTGRGLHRHSSSGSPKPTGLSLLGQVLDGSPLLKPHPAARPAPDGHDENSSLPTTRPAASIENDRAPEAEHLEAAPVIQNTFNVNVHMEGGLEGNEEALGQRLNRILIEQARRYGIDI